MSFSTFNTIHIRNKSSKCCKKSSNSNNFSDCDIDKLIQAVTDKISTSMITDRLILEYYEILYNEIIIHINEILITFQNNTIEEILKLYNNDTFLSLITKIATIKNNLIANFCDPNNLPKFVNIFINNYIENLYTLLYSFSFMIHYISNFDQKNRCCEILSSLESIQEYVRDRYRQQGPTIGATAISSLPLVLKEPYNTYIERHGAPGKEGFITSLLADIAAELGI
jgi:hypothetical protein